MSKMLAEPIISFDFDETLTNVGYSQFNEAMLRGEDPAAYANLPVIELLTRLYNDGCHIIVWTCRHTKQDMWIVKEFLKRMEIYHMVEAINENLNALINKFGDTRKVFADYYIDNANVFAELDDFGNYDKCDDMYRFIIDHDSYYAPRVGGKKKK